MRLLLDEHLSPGLGDALRRAGHDAVALQEWRGREFMGAADDIMLAAAAEDDRVLLTADEATIRPLLRAWHEADRDHAGVIFLRGTETAASHIGDIMRRIGAMELEGDPATWRNRVLYLPW